MNNSVHHLPNVPPDLPEGRIISPNHVLSRRALLQAGLVALMGGTTSLPWKESFGKDDEHLTKDQIDALFLKANEHAFMKDPEAWWQKNRDRVKPLFEKKVETCECIECADEGAQEEGDTISEVGSGILYQRGKYPAMKDRRRAYADNLHNLGIKPKVITSHYQCGGADAAAEEQGYKHSGDQFAIEWSQSLAEEMGVHYKHIGQKEMDRPSIHDAPGILYSPGAAPHYKQSGLPKLVKISRGAIGDDAHAVSELALGLNVLRSDHGFENRFDKEHPCKIVIPRIDRNRVLSDKSIAEARAAAKGQENIEVIVLE